MGATDAFYVYNPTGTAGEIYCRSSGINAIMYSGTFTTDQSSQVLYTAEIADKGMGVGINMTSSGGGNYYGFFSDNGSSYFVKVTNGSVDWRAYGTSWIIGHTYKIEKVGSELRCYDNGTLDASVSGGGFSGGKWTDPSSLTGGNPGLVGYGGSSTGTRVDNWVGINVGGGDPLVGGTITPFQSILYGADPLGFSSTSPASGGTGSYVYTWQYSSTTSIPGESGWIDVAGNHTLTYYAGMQTQTRYWIRMVNDGVTTAYSNFLAITVAGKKTYANAWKMNIMGAPPPMCDVSEWNNPGNQGPGELSLQLNDTLGNVTNVILYNEDGYGGYCTNGMSTGPYAACINQTSWIFATTDNDFEIRNLDDSKMYDIEFYASQTNESAITGITIGTVHDDITSYNNTSDKAIFNSIYPTGGTIRFRITKTSGNYSYLGAVVLREIGGIPLYAGVITDNNTIQTGTAPPSFTSILPASGGTAPYVYAWQYSNTGSTNWHDIGGSNSLTWSLGVQTQTTYYRRKVVDNVLDAAYSNPLKITVINSSSSLIGGSILYFQTVPYLGVPDPFVNSTSPSGGTPPYTYTWQYNTLGTWLDIGGSNSLTWSLGAQTQTADYRRRVVDQVPTTAYSNVLTITVGNKPFIGRAILLKKYPRLDQFGKSPMGTYPRSLILGASTSPPAPSVKLFPFNIISGDKMSHDQDGVIPANCVNGDDVFQLRVNCTDSAYNAGAEVYSWTEISGDYNNAFTVSSTGRIQVSDDSQIAGGSNYNLQLSVSDISGTVRTEIVYARIHVIPVDSCKFTDLDAVSNGSGTRGSPYNSMSNMQAASTSGYLDAGITYFVKRNTTSPTGDYFIVRNPNNPTKWIRIAAYGQSETLPKMQGNSSYPTGIWIGTSEYAYPQTQAGRTKRVRIYDLEIKDYTSVGANGTVHVFDGTQAVQLKRLVISNSNNIGLIYFKNFWPDSIYFYGNNLVQDCELSYNYNQHGIKGEPGGITMRNNYIHNCVAWGIQCAWGARNTVEYFYGKNNGGDINFRRPRFTMQYFVCRSINGTASRVSINIEKPTETDGFPDTCLIKNGYSYSNYSSNVYYTQSIAGRTVVSAIVDHVIFDFRGTNSASNAAIELQSTATLSGLVVSNCVFRGTSGSGIYINSTGVINSTFFNNIFYNLGYYGIAYNAFGSGNAAYNNTAYGNGSTDFFRTGTTTIGFKNNVGSVTSSVYWNPSSNNTTYSAGMFTDPAGHNFYPAVGSTLINAGTNTGIGVDIVGTTRPQDGVYDIGAYEYIP